MKFNIYVPTFIKKTIDFRQWYYVIFDGEEEGTFWYLQYEVDELIEDYKKCGLKLPKIIIIPLYKTIIH